jgi:hypothetical protein
MLKPTGLPAILVAFGLAVGVAGCGSEPVATPDVAATTATVSTTATTTSTPSATTPSAATTPSPAATKASQRFVCPKGGVEEAAELQRSVDQGHQPWWLSPKDVAAACTFGVPDATVKALGADTYRVTQTSTGKKVVVNETQPGRSGSTGIWVVTKLTPAP